MLGRFLLRVCERHRTQCWNARGHGAHSFYENIFLGVGTSLCIMSAFNTFTNRFLSGVANHLDAQS